MAFQGRGANGRRASSMSHGAEQSAPAHSGGYDRPRGAGRGASRRSGERRAPAPRQKLESRVGAATCSVGPTSLALAFTSPTSPVSATSSSSSSSLVSLSADGWIDRWMDGRTGSAGGGASRGRPVPWADGGEGRVAAAEGGGWGGGGGGGGDDDGHGDRYLLARLRDKVRVELGIPAKRRPRTNFFLRAHWLLSSMTRFVSEHFPAPLGGRETKKKKKKVSSSVHELSRARYQTRYE